MRTFSDYVMMNRLKRPDLNPSRLVPKSTFLVQVNSELGRKRRPECFFNSTVRTCLLCCLLLQLECVCAAWKGCASVACLLDGKSSNHSKFPKPLVPWHASLRWHCEVVDLIHSSCSTQLRPDAGLGSRHLV